MAAEVAGAPKVEVPKPEPNGLMSELPALPKLPNVNPPVEGLSSLFVVVVPKPENPEEVLVS